MTHVTHGLGLVASDVNPPAGAPRQGLEGIRPPQLGGPGAICFIYTSLFTVNGSKYIKKTQKSHKKHKTIYKMSNLSLIHI